MATKKTSKTTTKKAKAAPKAARAPKPKAAKAPTGDLVTFAVRLPRTDAAAFHKAAGPAGGSKFARRIMNAFAQADESAFRAALKDAKANRG